MRIRKLLPLVITTMIRMVVMMTMVIMKEMKICLMGRRQELIKVREDAWGLYWSRYKSFVCPSGVM